MFCSFTACNNKSTVQNIWELGKHSIGVAEACENIELIKIEDGYEYFRIKEDIINGEATIADGEKVLIDDESSEAEDSILVTKVKDGVCYVYRNTPDVLYMTLEYSDVTDEDKKAVDLSQYE